MIKGLTQEQELIVQTILEPYKTEYEFYFYGSRVKGGFEKTSDLDVLIKGNQEMPYNTLELIKFAFDQSALPFIVNFSDYQAIDEKFFNLIKKDLVKV